MSVSYPLKEKECKHSPQVCSHSCHFEIKRLLDPLDDFLPMKEC